jgi:hypothetical protein
MKMISILKASALTVLLAAGAAACDDSDGTTASMPTATMDGQGMFPSEMSVPSTGVIRFVNGDSRAHEVYSADCSELSSGVLQPGEEWSTQVSAGPRTCHVQDLLAPDTQTYWGTIEIALPLPPTSDQA